MNAPRIWFDGRQEPPHPPSFTDMLWGMAGSTAIAALYLLANYFWPVP